MMILVINLKELAAFSNPLDQIKRFRMIKEHRCEGYRLMEYGFSSRLFVMDMCSSTWKIKYKSLEELEAMSNEDNKILQRIIKD